MAEVQLTRRSTNIPVVKIPLSGSQQSLIPSSRLPNNGVPLNSPPTSSSLNHSGVLSPSNNPKLRTLRSLLPFGPGKTPVTNANGSNASKGPFLNFGNVRRSMTGERMNSFSRPRPEENSGPPVISIHPSYDQNLTFKSYVESQPPSKDSSFSSLSLPHSQRDRPILPPLSPVFPLPADLSTITEADTSGISKHIPLLDDSERSVVVAADDFVSGSPSLSVPPESENAGVYLTPDGRDDSTFDLSASRIKAEVLDAMRARDAEITGQWLNGDHVLAVDDVEHDDRLFGQGDPSLSFNLGELDPDLAALLSPNHITKSDMSMPVPRRLASKSFDIPREITPPSSLSQKPSRIPSTHGIESQSPPVRHSFSTSRPLIRPIPSTLPRFRLASSHSIPLQPEKALPSLPPTSISTPASPSMDVRTSSDSFRRNKQLDITIGPHSSATPVPKHISSRLATPSRYALYGGSSTRKSLAASVPTLDMRSNSSSSLRLSSMGQATTTPTTATENRSTRVHRPSLDISEQADVTERDRSRLLRSRKRSMSLEDHRGSVRSNPSSSYIQTRSSSSVVRPSSSQSYAKPPPDWYGRGMVTSADKLLDADIEALSRSVSRLGSGSVRGGHERDYSRSNQTSSKTTLSDVSGSIVSRARGISHTSTAATSPDTGESIGVESPVVSAYRTNFSTSSAVSTSASGVSISSAQHQRMQVALQSLKDKHEMEMAALLSALSDSQRVAKVLREENDGLRQQIQELERQLEDTLRQSQLYQATVIPHNSISTHLLPGSSPESKSWRRSSDDVQRQFPVRLQSTLSPHNPTLPHSTPFKTQVREQAHHSVLPELVTKATDLKRLSAASSIFPTPPSNMAMLMSEEGAMNLIPDRSSVFSTGSISPPPSHGTRPLSRRLSTSAPISTRTQHKPNRSISSAGDGMSITTANFSMTEMTGSPGSLCLRPEHEMHLGDMVSLDLSYQDEGDNFSG